MKSLKKYTILSRIKLIILFASIVAFLFTAFALLLNDFLLFQNNYIRDLSIVARVTSANLHKAILENKNTEIKTVLKYLDGNPFIVYAAIYDTSGNLITFYSRSSDFVVPRRIEEASKTNRDFIHIFHPIKMNGRFLGTLFIKRSKGELYQRFLQYLGLMFLIFSGAVIFVLFLISRLKHFVFNPLKELSDITIQISENRDYSIRAQRYKNDEIGILANQFNEMLEQIHMRDEELQRSYDELEKRVEERTIELAKINTDLEDEIHERQNIEDRMAASIKEKDLLLKEIHHRVKNNLQVISSLLSLQSRHIKDLDSLAMFKESQDRVRSMALVHEKIYQSLDMAHINFTEYIQSLASSLFRSYGTGPNKVQLVFDTESVTLGIDMAVPCALVLNELISNALKHAFPDIDSRQGQIKIGLHEISNTEIELYVEDNGVGLENELVFGESQSLGMKLVQILIQDQLSGTLDIERDGGTKFIIRFNPLAHLEESETV